MPTAPKDEDVRAVLDPVWFNTFWVKNALGLYEGVSKHAEQLNANYGHFFGLLQKFSLDSAVLGICKLYDVSNVRYEKDTVPALFAYLKNHVTDQYTAMLKVETLTALGVSKEKSNELVYDLRATFTTTKDGFLNVIEELIPKSKTNEALRSILTARDKIIAHQEHLSYALEEELRSLPSLDEMEKLNTWATNFCILFASLSTNVTLLQNGPSARMAALNVVGKLLNKDFDQPGTAAAAGEYEAFFSRL